MPDSFVEWKAPYGSAQLNRKLSHITDAGVYEGYWVSVSGSDEITIGTSNPDGSTDPANVAVVERGGYSLTIRNSSAQTLSVPSAEGLYHAVVEAKYQVGQATVSQLKIVADGNEASHEIIVGSVRRESGGSLTALPRGYREWAEPFLGAVKANDESVSNSTTLQPDDSLSGIVLLGGETYHLLFEFWVTYSNGELKYQITADDSANANAYLEEYFVLRKEVISSTVRFSLDDTVMPSYSSRILVRVTGLIEVKSDIEMSLEWAQRNDRSDPTKVLEGSSFKANRIL